MGKYEVSKRTLGQHPPPPASSKKLGPTHSSDSNGVEAKIYSDTFSAARAKFREYVGERGRRDTQEIISRHEFKKGLESTLFFPLRYKYTHAKYSTTPNKCSSGNRFKRRVLHEQA